jgi:hypothetical protein
MNKTTFVTAVLLLGGNLAIAQQTLVMNGGQILHGRYDGGNADTVFFIDDHGNRHRFNISEIQNLMFNGAPPRDFPTADRFSGGGYQPTVRREEYADMDAQPDYGWNRTATIPAGTEIVVRTIDRIDSSAADPQRRYLASIERDVVDSNGNLVIPRDASAHLIVNQAVDGRMAIDLRSVNVNGRRYVLNSEDITNARGREGLGANSRTGKFVGGGAIIGGIIGAVAGGGKGAAIGAVAGGAAGAGAEVATSGPRVHIPSETILRFRLDHPVYLYQ